MVCLVVPILVTANNPAQRWLGKYWKPLQRMTYAMWALLFLHLALLEGFGLPATSRAARPTGTRPSIGGCTS
jgi:DMSO/TMAO reductase YedYZ heme-binding membrane subunit